MIDLFKSVILLLLTPECFDQYFVNFNFFDGECMRATISKALGLIVIAGSVTVKVPQIIKIINNKSGKGISLFGSSLELTAITLLFSYSYLKQFPFSAWGDGLFLAIQTVTVIGLILYYQKRLLQLTLFLVIYVSVVFVFITETVPLSVLWTLQILNLPIVLVGKGVQVLTNYRNRSTGQLSAATCWMQFAGSTARVFTSIQETGDALMILSFLLASILNGTIVFQLFFYSKPSQKKSKGKSKGKKSQ